MYVCTSWKLAFGNFTEYVSPISECIILNNTEAVKNTLNMFTPCLLMASILFNALACLICL